MVTDTPPESQSLLQQRLLEVIAQLRHDDGMTLEELADRSGLHRTTLGLVERGVRGLSIASAQSIANALGLPLSRLIALSEAHTGSETVSVPTIPRRLNPNVLRGEEALQDLCGLPGLVILEAIEYVYDTFDLIDSELVARGSEPLASLVELANLSSMIGNLLGAGIAKASEGKYIRNRPHAFPDLVPQASGLPELEIKTALETNSPKGHLAKPGVYLTFRYVLGANDGSYSKGKENRGQTAWLWEVRVGRLEVEDFSISNTDGDSGKTAVIRTESFKGMTPILQEDRFNPYSRPWG